MRLSRCAVTRLLRLFAQPVHQLGDPGDHHHHESDATDDLVVVNCSGY